MKAIGTNSVSLLGAGLALALIIAPAEAVDPTGDSRRVPQTTAVTGYLDWTLVPVNLGPYLIVGTDGDSVKSCSRKWPVPWAPKPTWQMNCGI